MITYGNESVTALVFAAAGLLLALSGEVLIVDGQALAQALRTAALFGLPQGGAA